MNSIWGAVIVPLVWLIDIGWIVEGETSWTLNAQNQVKNMTSVTKLRQCLMALPMLI